jgi:hypothetical protein
MINIEALEAAQMEYPANPGMLGSEADDEVLAPRQSSDDSSIKKNHILLNEVSNRLNPPPPKNLPPTQKCTLDCVT